MILLEQCASWAADVHVDDLDATSGQRARDGITDCLGGALAAIGESGPVAVWRFLELSGDCRADHEAALLGRGIRASAPNAALHTGVLAHALDYDDVAHPANAHLTCSIVSALLAVAPRRPPLGAGLLTAFAVGYEVAAKIGRALPRSERAGVWHPTGVLGVLGAAVAVARASGLPASQVAHAIGIAASLGSGLRGNLGSMTKPLHAGRAAQAGVTAARLAAGGFTASLDVLESRLGFLRQYGRTDGGRDPVARAREQIAQLGRPWELATDEGINIKLFPACAGAQAGIEAALAVRQRVGNDQIAAVRVGTPVTAPDVLIHHRPQLGVHGKFSMEYCVAAALLHGRVGIDSFTDEAVTEPAVRAMIERVDMEIDARVAGSTEHAAVVAVRTVSGAQYEELVELAQGKPARWPRRDDLDAKFLDCAGRALGAAGARQALMLLRDETPDAAAELDALLAGPVR